MPSKFVAFRTTWVVLALLLAGCQRFILQPFSAPIDPVMTFNPSVAFTPVAEFPPLPQGILDTDPPAAQSIPTSETPASKPVVLPNSPVSTVVSVPPEPFADTAPSAPEVTVEPSAPVATVEPAAPLLDCASATDDDSFFAFTALPRKLNQRLVTIVDAERPTPRTTDRYQHHKVIYFSEYGNSPGAELRLTTGSYVPYLGNTGYETVERHTISPEDRYKTGAYREIFINTKDRTAMYASLLSLPAEMNVSRSNAALCAKGDFDSCDHTVVAGQAWAWNLSGAALFNAGNYHRWTNAMVQSSQGGYFFNMNKPTSLGMTQYFYQTTTFAQMSYYPGYNAVNLGNTAVWLSEGRSQVYPFKNIVPALDMQNAFVVEHFTGCDAGSKAPELQDRCNVYEAHLYGQSSAHNLCQKKMPLGLVGIFIGTTRKANGVGIKIDHGIATYEAN